MSDLKRSTQQYFDARSHTYDQDELHHHVASQLIVLAALEPGHHVLDIATGTGLLALHAARRVGPQGHVTGVDLSAGMLAQAQRKAQEQHLQNVTFLQADAQQLPFQPASFDRVLCSSALVLMPDVSAALHNWAQVLRPGALLIFDAPDNQAFGIGGMITQVAASHGIELAYADVAPTHERCQLLLRNAGLEVLEIQTRPFQDQLMSLEEALAAWDQTLQHPAWQQLRDLPSEQQAVLQQDFEARLAATAPEGQVRVQVRLHLTLGKKPTAPAGEGS